MTSAKIDTEDLREDHALVLVQVSNTSFRRSFFGGYKSADVDNFFQQAADVLHALVEENRSLKAGLAKAHEFESGLRSTIAASQESAGKIVETARREAVTMLDEAIADKEREQYEAERRPDALAMDIAGLRSTIAASQETAEKIVDAARREAAALFEEAIAGKEREKYEAERRPDALAMDIAVLGGKRERLVKELDKIAHDQQQLFDAIRPIEPADSPLEADSAPETDSPVEANSALGTDSPVEADSSRETESALDADSGVEAGGAADTLDNDAPAAAENDNGRTEAKDDEGFSSVESPFAAAESAESEPAADDRDVHEDISRSDSSSRS